MKCAQEFFTWKKTDSSADKMIAYIDGASQGNPGPAGIGIVIKKSKDKEEKQVSKYIGTVTNNVAEYAALIWALQEAVYLGVETIKIYTDSQLLSRQLTGRYKVKSPNISVLYQLAVNLINKIPNFEIEHIKREKNKAADKLATQAIKYSKSKIE